MRVYVLRSNRLDCKSILNEYSRVLLPKYTGKQRIIKSARPTPRRNFISLIPTISRYRNKISRQNLDRYYQAIVKCVQAVYASRHSLMNFNPRFNIDECPPRILHSPTPPSLPQTKFLSTLETPKVLTSLEHCFHQNTSSPFPPFLEILNQPFFPTSVQEPSSRHHQPPALRKPENIQKPIDPPLPPLF